MKGAARGPARIHRKTFIYSYQFEALLEPIPEPYATMVYLPVWTGLRVSELAGLKWYTIEPHSISVERRYCRGERHAPKTNASAARIVASDDVLARIHRLKTLEVEINCNLLIEPYGYGTMDLMVGEKSRLH